MSEFITIISDANAPSDFSTQFDTTFNLTGKYEVSLKSIFYGPLCNVCDHNDLIVLRLNGTETRELRLKHGYYPTTYYLISAINDAIVFFYNNLGEDDANWAVSGVADVKFTTTTKSTGETNNVTLILPKNVKFYHHPWTHGASNVLEMFNIQRTANMSKISVKDTKLKYNHQVGFVYSSLIKNSKINNKNSRLLATLPLYTDDGYSDHFFVDPAYYPLAVTSFENISFQIRDYNGNLIDIAHKEVTDMRDDKPVRYPTILTLHIRKRL